MTGALLKLCGLRVESAAHVSGAEFVLRNKHWLGWIIGVGLALAMITWASYRRDAAEMVSKGKRRVLTALRIVLFALLGLLLLRPVVAFTVESAIRRTLLTLVDASGSMKIQDPRVDAADLKRAAIAKGILDPSKGLDQQLDATLAANVKLVPRVEIMRGMLGNEQLQLFPQLSKELDLAAFSFGANLNSEGAEGEIGDSAEWLARLDPVAASTAIGDAVRDLIQRKRGQPLAGIFLVTDGANNHGSAPRDAARLAKQEGIPLYIYGVGITSPRDIIVGSMLTQEVAFVKDELPVTVRVRGQGLKGESTKLVMRLVPVNSTGEGEVVATKDITFGDDEDAAVPVPFTPKAIGDFELRASIAPRADEASKDNNSVAQRLRVIDSKVKILYVETTPRWEFRYLQSVLLRDRRVDLKCVLLEGDESIAAGDASPFLAKVPAKKDDLFKFDLIIIGDVEPRAFTPEHFAAFEEFVQKFGGSMLFIAGPRANPAAYRNTTLEKLLPVELDPAAAVGNTLQPSPSQGVTAELTPQGRAEPMLKLAATDDESAAIWKRFGKLYSTARVLRAKPATQVLLVDADQSRANRHGKQVIAAFHQYGLGQILYMGTDNTWRWRRNAGDQFYPLLWGQIAQKLGLHHLLGGSKRTQLTADRQNYTTGERVTVYARLYASDFSPVKEQIVAAGYTVRVAGAPWPLREVPLRAVLEQPGMYRGDFVALEPGAHQFSVKSDPATVLEVNVTEPKFETGETAMNEVLLRQMAEASGGAYFREETLAQFPKAISAKAERIQGTLDGELWSSPLAFLLLFTVATLEWALRKRWQLK